MKQGSQKVAESFVSFCPYISLLLTKRTFYIFLTLIMLVGGTFQFFILTRYFSPLNIEECQEEFVLGPQSPCTLENKYKFL